MGHQTQVWELLRKKKENEKKHFCPGCPHDIGIKYWIPDQQKEEPQTIFLLRCLGCNQKYYSKLNTCIHCPHCDSMRFEIIGARMDRGDQIKE